MTDLEVLLLAAAHCPDDDTGWLALADCLAEQGDEARAELVRIQLALRRRLDAPDWPGMQRRQDELWRGGVRACLPTWPGPFAMEFVLIPPGTFWMGAADGEEWMDGDELPRRRVKLPRGFYLGRWPVTQRQYAGLMRTNPSHAQDVAGALPVESVSHADCLLFCRHLGRVMNRTCRLPSEAEWEYACRAGTTTMFCSGEGAKALREVGWCSYDGEWDGSGGTRPVGGLRANPWGLYDMHGNVWEWCADWFSSMSYATGPDVAPTGPVRGTEKVVRGGSWRGGPWFCRSAERRAIDPGSREINVGFRVVVELE